MKILSPDVALALPEVAECIARGFIEVKDDRIHYMLKTEQDHSWLDPEEWVRCASIAALIVTYGYPPQRMLTEVLIPRRVPGDYADIVVFRDDRCKVPYLVVENKAEAQGAAARKQAIEQAIGNAHSLRAVLALYDGYSDSLLFDTSGAYGAMEREENRRGDRTRIPRLYSADAPKFRFIANDQSGDIAPADARKLETKVRRTHSLIWAGGKRDPLTAFDEWSKLLFAKVHDERTTPNGKPRRFQVGSGETDTAVSSRIHELFAVACKEDTSIFPPGLRIKLPDDKMRQIVETLQDISIISTDADVIGQAFERFFGSVFRGELGQYFTMRQISRFTVAAVGVDNTDYVIDPTAGSGGFLLEALLQGWHQIERDFSGQQEIDRKKYDFAMNHVYGIEIHEVLARILKINLLLHHDGHTNIEGDRSCLDTEFVNPRLRNKWKGGFTRVIGNPPFGDTVRRGDRDLLGTNELETFQVAEMRSQVPSEHLILERGVDMLGPDGRLAFVLPDGVFNNQGERSNCPQTRRFLARAGVIEAIISLPDYAFRKSGAQNKTSVLIFRKFSVPEKRLFENAFRTEFNKSKDEDAGILAGLDALDYSVFLAEANFIGYTTTGVASDKNELFNPDNLGFVADNQNGTILGELRRFRDNPKAYEGSRLPDCMGIRAADMWSAHGSHRLDPKYFLFKLEERTITPDGWVREPIRNVMRRRDELVRPQTKPDDPVVVLTVSQTGELRAREAGKGKNPPEWQGMYFEDMPTKWYAAHTNDVVFSGIDLWKGCISVVPEEFDGALVSSEFPVYEITDDRLDRDFVSTLLRSRYYRRAFRAITTGHSNRRRTQVEDFEALEICFPADSIEQRRLVADVIKARQKLRDADRSLKQAMLAFSDVIDSRGDEEYEYTDDEDEAEAEA
ncbi:N-6 DNA methylase [Cellulosimicrobium cellulans]|uniref:N-6 DNA methylase n=1 Tax=Cellulosimicrobium cellulans TaxID=1710 RepID=UPI00196401AD|nr:N-6 DNA methylase [Cellulosimicrobium cellulans]MBN0041849.1 N-6 DNA methylase [Cellulosimicrobium cellulans]